MQDKKKTQTILSVSGQRRKTFVLPSGIEATVLSAKTGFFDTLLNEELLVNRTNLIQAFSNYQVIEHLGKDTVFDKNYFARMSQEDIDALLAAIRDVSYTKKQFTYYHDWSEANATKRKIVKHTVICEFDDYQIRYATPDGEMPEKLFQSYSEIPEYAEVETIDGKYRVDRIMLGNKMAFLKQNTDVSSKYVVLLFTKPRKILDDGQVQFLDKADIENLEPEVSADLLGAINSLHGSIDTSVDISYEGKQARINLLSTANFFIPIHK
jgi:hypothetical protein